MLSPRFVIAIIGLFSVFLGGCSRREQPDRDRTFIHGTQAIQAPEGLTDLHWTMVGGRVVAVSSGPTPSIRIRNPSPGAWEESGLELPPGSTIGQLLSSPTGTLLAEGNGGQRLWWLQTRAGSTLQLLALPDLPNGLRLDSATVLAGRVYLAGVAGPDGAAMLVSTPTGAAAGTWTRLALPDDLPHGRLNLATQSNGERPHLMVAGQSERAAGLFSYEPERQVWRTLEATEQSLDSAYLTPVGLAHVYLLRAGALVVYNTVTRVWTRPFPFPEGGQPVATSNRGTVLEVLTVDAANQATLVTSSYQTRVQSLHWADYSVIAGFTVALVAMGVINSRRFRSAESYFRGGKKIPWLAAGLSVVATGQSATSFISLPARSFATNWQFSLVPLTNVVGALIMSRFFVRFFVRLNITSAYEYLEVRFSSLVRTVGSINYLAYELTRISLLILVPAVAVSAVTKIDIQLAIVMMGAIATLYTTLGGLEGVVWADVVQILVKITAILLVVIMIFAQLEGSPLELAALAWNEGKLRAIDWSFDLTRDTFWALILFWLTDGLKSYVANQTVIQRFISTRDERTAQQSVKASAIIGTLIFWTFMLAGTGLFLFYRQNPERLDLTMDKPDAVFPWFILFELPPGVAGFLITALVAAALSSLYGALNSTSTVMVTDFYRRFVAGASDQGAVKLGRRLTLAVGVLATGLSLLLAGMASRSLVEQTLTVIGLFGGGLGGLFLVGMLTDRVSAKSALVGFCVSALVQYYVSNHTPLHWLTYMFTGMGSCFAAAYLASFVWPDGPRRPGLTVHTCAR